MNKVRDFFILIRWQNLLFLGIVVWTMEKWVAVPILAQQMFGELLPWYVQMTLLLSVLLVAAGGYVINDYFDVKIDAINRPDSLIITRSIDKITAMRIHQCLTGFGVLASLVTAYLLHDWQLGIVLLVVPGLLWFYSASYKRQFLLGNLIVALCAAIVPFIIAMANVSALQYYYMDELEYITTPADMYLWLGGFSLFAFLMTWIREIIKDMQDQMGDRELECHTMPIVLGELWTKVIVTVLILITSGLMIVANYYMPFEHGWYSLSARYLLYGLLIPMGGTIWLLWAARISSDYRTAQQVMKFVIFMGTMYSFVVLRCLV